MEPLISVIVPVYKAEQYLHRCLDSITAQTYRNLEIILVDDGSPDRCGEICEEYARKDGRIHVVHQENRGMSAARNVALNLATGTFFCFVDSDDIISLELCEKTVKIFSENDVQIVAFNCERITEDGRCLGGTETLTEGVISKEEALAKLVKGEINDYMWSKVFKRSLFDDIRFSEQLNCFEDMDITYRLFLKVQHIYCLNEQLYNYYLRSNSTSAVLTVKKRCDLYQTRLERYRVLQTCYPQIAEQALFGVAAAALYLYDQSLVEVADEVIIADAQRFLEDNQKTVLALNRSMKIRMYYFLPVVYRWARHATYIAGNLVRHLKRKMK